MAGADTSLAIRVRDPESVVLRAFQGLSWFPIDARWRSVGTFRPFPQPRPVPILNIRGDPEPFTSPGEVEVTIDNTPVRLLAVSAGKQLQFIFNDRGAGRDTYGIRFLYADLPDAQGRVVLDFNRAYNPPCAHNPYTTCPVPPPQNRLPMRVLAGERLPKS